MSSAPFMAEIMGQTTELVAIMTIQYVIKQIRLFQINKKYGLQWSGQNMH